MIYIIRATERNLYFTSYTHIHIWVEYLKNDFFVFIKYAIYNFFKNYNHDCGRLTGTYFELLFVGQKIYVAVSQGLG